MEERRGWGKPSEKGAPRHAHIPGLPPGTKEQSGYQGSCCAHVLCGHHPSCLGRKKWGATGTSGGERKCSLPLHCVWSLLQLRENP